MYHRIADEPIDNWGLAVSPAHFEEQLDVLRRVRRPFPLPDFVHNLMTGSLPPNAVAVTFDDGYVDNLTAGKPRLAAAGVPATVFLATGFLDRPGEFWWDELARLVLVGDGPRRFEIIIGTERMQVDLGKDRPAQRDATGDAASLEMRRAALKSIWQSLRLLEEDPRESTLATLRSILSVADDRADRGRPMTRNEVRTLASDGLVTIGAHSVTHPVLSRIGAVACHREVTESKATCEDVIGKPVAGFAYPFGDFDADVSDAVKAAGFAFACSTRHGRASAASEVLALPRMQVYDWDGDRFERALRQ